MLLLQLVSLVGSPYVGILLGDNNKIISDNIEIIILPGWRHMILSLLYMLPKEPRKLNMFNVFVDDLEGYSVAHAIGGQILSTSICLCSQCNRTTSGNFLEGLHYYRSTSTLTTCRFFMIVTVPDTCVKPLIQTPMNGSPGTAMDFLLNNYSSPLAPLNI